MKLSICRQNFTNRKWVSQPSNTTFASQLVPPSPDVSQTDLDYYLADFTLSTDTAKGVLALQKLAEEHHCGANLTVEPYEGLRKVRPLVVTTTVATRHDATLGIKIVFARFTCILLICFTNLVRLQQSAPHCVYSCRPVSGYLRAVHTCIHVPAHRRRHAAFWRRKSWFAT